MEDQDMYIPSDRIDEFRGIYDKNSAGETLEVFLDNYDPKTWDNPSATVDTIVATMEGGKIKKVMLIRRGNHPSIGMWALPGGFVEYRENLKDAALRELSEETGIEGIDAVQLKTYGDWDRDPRTRIITTAFASIVDEKDIVFAAGDDAAQADWFEVDIKDNADGTYDLTLVSDKDKIRIGCVVREERKVICGIEERSYKVVKRDGIAADHGAIILESILILEDKLKGNR